jgi:hypothetical protein
MDTATAGAQRFTAGVYACGRSVAGLQGLRHGEDIGAATCCNMLQLELQHAATGAATGLQQELQHAATCCNMLQQELQHTATGNMLQQELQHAATGLQGLRHCQEARAGE